jgi:hypothetical protein
MQPKIYWILSLVLLVLIFVCALGTIPIMLQGLASEGGNGALFALIFILFLILIGCISVCVFVLFVLKYKEGFYFSLFFALFLLLGYIVIEISNFQSIMSWNASGGYTEGVVIPLFVVLSGIYSGPLIAGLLLLILSYKSRSVFGVDKVFPYFGKVVKK